MIRAYTLRKPLGADACSNDWPSPRPIDPAHASTGPDDPAMSTSTGAGPSKRRGQYATRACNGCRRRRVKCDGVQPVCGTCAHNSRECDWSADFDARRPGTKSLVDSLRARIQQLEAEVEQLRGRTSPVLAINPLALSTTELPPDSPAHQSRLGSATESVRISSFLISLADIRLCPTTLPQQIELPNVSEIKAPQQPESLFTALVMYQYIFQIDSSGPAHEQSKDIQLSLVCDWDRYLPQLSGITFSRQEHDTLLLRSFKYGTSWLMGLVPELFLHDMLYSLTSLGSESFPRPRLQHYSPMLHCAIMAFACAFSDDPAIRAPETRGYFASRAKQWLDEELRHPAMSLVRSMTLLAEYSCGVGQMNTGYMYMGDLS
ncbi:hypothetical protein FRC12_010115 [Ceratobasidium sp. 428]|nr:hypothetical protein FRC12_010115 [Ceratobasidium sp. 428]